MIFYHVLDEVFATWSHIAVLRVMQNSARGMTGREIARLSGMNHRSCLKALSALESLSIVIRIRGGRDHLFMLNHEHFLVKEGILPLMRTERNFTKELSALLKRSLARETASIVLFGSVARREEKNESDVDVCFVVKQSIEKEKVRNRIHKLLPLIRKRFGANLSPLLLTVAEFSKKARRGHPPVSSIMKEGIVLSGKKLSELKNAEG